MWTWLSDNSSTIQAISGIVTAIVWIVYLQIFVSSFRRQRRSEILIHTGGNRADPRIFVSNLGFENIYVIEILLCATSAEGRREASVIDQNDVEEGGSTPPSGTTFQGPLGSGAYMDIGSLDDLLERARNNNDGGTPATGRIKDVEIRVVAITAATSSVVAARREFVLVRREGTLRVIPRTLYAIQTRSWWGRRRIERELKKKLLR